MLEANVTLLGFDTMDRDIGHAVEVELARLMEESAERARQSDAFRDKTGALRASVFSGTDGSWSGGDLAGFYGADAEHASHIEEGTRAHIIRPTGSKLGRGAGGRFKRTGGGKLRFEVGGKVMFRAVVHHPGTKATHWLARITTPQRVAEVLTYAASHAGTK